MTSLAQFQLFVFWFFRQKQCDYVRVFPWHERRDRWSIMIDKTCLCRIACFSGECFRNEVRVM